MIQLKRAKRSSTSLRNGILGALPLPEYERLVEKMERVELKIGAIVYEADESIEYVYFPEDAVVALVHTLQDARTLAVGIIGPEGLVGIDIFLGGESAPERALVQIGGNALRMKTFNFRLETRFATPLRLLLLRYTQVFLSELRQCAACSRHHSVDQRLARWILTMRDYTPFEIPASQGVMAAMLGVRRAGISIAAFNFKARGLISYSRGRITVLGRWGLERESCECYHVIKKRYRAMSPRILHLTS